MTENPAELTKPFRVLVVDGGGMRGLYTTALLRTLVGRFNTKFKTEEPDLGKAFNLICGTSTGSILACSLAAGIPLSVVQELYQNYGQKIFKSPVPTTKEPIKLFLWTVGHLLKPSSNAKMLKKVLEETFGNVTLGEVFKKRGISLCIPTINFVRQKAWVFKTPHTTLLNRDETYQLSDVCLASSAAPILFPIAKIKGSNQQDSFEYFVDGGLWANNPSLVGLTEALLLAKPKQNIEIISIGTCSQPTGDPSLLGKVNWGLWKWRFGIGITETAISAQSFGYSNMTRLLSKYLSNSDRTVRFTKLIETNKSPQQYSAIGVDKGNKLAIETLLELAKMDVDTITSVANYGDNENEYQFVRNIFENVESLAKKTEEKE